MDESDQEGADCCQCGIIANNQFQFPMKDHVAGQHVSIEEKPMANDLEKLIENVAARASNRDIQLAWVERADGSRILDCETAEEYPLGDEWLFKATTDQEAKRILAAYIAAYLSDELDIGFALMCQIARLLAEKGNLVAPQLEVIVRETDWATSMDCNLVLAGLLHVENGETETIRILDLAFEDGRDGIFFACWTSRSQAVQAKLLSKFEEWMKNPNWGPGTGESTWLGLFIAKWLRESIFDFGRLRKPIEWYFAHVVDRN